MLIHALHVIMAVLAVWRLTELFLQDKITEKIRKKFPTYILNCPRCFSVWASVVAVVAFLYFPWFNWPFALAWLYLWHNDSMYRKRIERDGRSLIVRIRTDGSGFVERMEFTPQELVGLMNSLVPPPPKQEAA